METFLFLAGLAVIVVLAVIAARGFGRRSEPFHFSNGDGGGTAGGVDGRHSYSDNNRSDLGGGHSDGGGGGGFGGGGGDGGGGGGGGGS